MFDSILDLFDRDRDRTRGGSRRDADERGSEGGVRGMLGRLMAEHDDDDRRHASTATGDRRRSIIDDDDDDDFGDGRRRDRRHDLIDD